MRALYLWSFFWIGWFSEGSNCSVSVAVARKKKEKRAREWEMKKQSFQSVASYGFSEGF